MGRRHGGTRTCTQQSNRARGGGVLGDNDDDDDDNSGHDEDDNNDDDGGWGGWDGRMKLGITAVEQQIHKDGVHRTTSQSDVIQANDRSQLTLNRFVKRRPHPASIMGGMKSNKRFRKPK